MATLVCEREQKQQSSKHTRRYGDRDGGEEIHICYDSNGKRQERQQQTRGMQNECEEGVYMVFMGAGEWEQARAV